MCSWAPTGRFLALLESNGTAVDEAPDTKLSEQRFAQPILDATDRRWNQVI